MVRIDIIFTLTFACDNEESQTDLMLVTSKYKNLQ